MVINIIEVVILMDLLIIAVCFLNDKEVELQDVSAVVQPLLLLPFIYACINVLGRVLLMLQ